MIPTPRHTTQPLPQPSKQPTFQPSYQPVCVYSGQPTTASQSLAPSTTTSVKPTNSALVVFTTELQSILTELAENYTNSNADYSSQYYNMNYRNGVNTAVSNCDRWSTFLRGEVATSIQIYNPMNIIFAIASGTESVQYISCNSSLIVGELASFLASSSPVSRYLERSCNDYKWTAFNCLNSSASPSLCINCNNPCVDYVLPSFIGIAPCQAPRIDSPVSVIEIQYSNRIQPPKIIFLDIISSNVSISVSGKLSGSGEIYCAAFPNQQLSDFSLPGSYQDIITQNNLASADDQKIVHLQIYGLTASTPYKLYCLTSNFGSMMPFSDALDNAYPFNTTCCKTISVFQASATIIYGQSFVSFLQFVIGNPPTESISISITYSSGNKTDQMNGVFFPQSIFVSSTFHGGAFKASLSTGLSQGCYLYEVHVSGPSFAEYAVDHQNLARDKTFCIVSLDAIQEAPLLVGAVYSEDGSLLKILFDTPTDKGGSLTVFNCSELFDFTCATKSKCQWIDSQTVYAFVFGASHCASPGENIFIRQSAAIRAACQSVSGLCPSQSQWPTASTLPIYISPPPSAVFPSVVIAMPSKIGPCDTLSLDLTGSTGSGGRPWSISSAFAQSSCNNVTFLNGFLNNSFSVDPITIVPSSYFTLGCTYSFHFTLCNFLNACGVASQSVISLNSVVPNIAVPGGSYQSITRKSLLTISSTASVAQCAGGRSIYSLSYSWSIFQGNVQSLSVVSISKDPTKLIVAPYSLISSNYYSIKLTVVIKETFQSATITTSVFVQPGDIVPVIAGGAQRNMRCLTSILVDASQSFDEDQNGVTGLGAGLSFAWSCMQMSPTFNETCYSSLRLSTNGDVITVFALSSSEGSVSQLTVSIRDSTGSRFAQSVISIHVLEANDAVLSASNNILTSVMLPSQTLQLTGNVQIPEAFLRNNSYAQWSVNDGQIDLKDIAVSSLQEKLNAMSVTLYLIIPPFSLPGGSSLTFTLSCCTLNGNPQYTSTVSVVVSAPPRPGTFSVNPSVGIEFSDSFHFSASQWTTSNYPLYYQFGYISQSSVDITVISKSLKGFGVSLLPAGNEVQNFTLSLFVHVFDSLSSNNTAFASVIVRMAHLAPSAGIVYDLLNISASASVDQIKQASGLVTSFLNSVNCSNAPNCSALHRQPCRTTPHTCSSCSSGYVGDSGDSNSPCISLNHYNNTRDSTSIQNCSNESHCGGIEVCFEGICRTPLKVCPADCSGHGQCNYFSTNSGLKVSQCFVGDNFCVAQCTCDSEYRDSSICNWNSTEMEKRRTARAQLISNVVRLMDTEYPDKESVAGWINVLSAVAQNSDELNALSALQILTLSKSIINQASSLEMGSSSLLSTLPAIDSATSAKSFHRNDSIGNHSSSLISLLQETGAAISLGMLPGQHPIQSVQNQFRIGVSVFSYNSLSSNATISSPNSPLENAIGQPTAKATFPCVNSNGTLDSFLRITTLTLRSALVSSAGQFQADPMLLSLSSSPCQQSSSSCEFDFFLPINSHSLQSEKAASNVTEFALINCQIGISSYLVHNCSSGYQMRMSCNGTFTGTVKSYCPTVSHVTVCETNIMPHLNAGSCQTIMNNADGVACRCKFTSKSSYQRHLQQSQGTWTVGAVPLLQAIVGGIRETIISAASLNESEIKREFTVLITIGTLTAVIIAAMYLSYRADKADSMKENFRTEFTKHRGTSFFESSHHKSSRSTTSRKFRKLPETEGDEFAIWEDSLPKILVSKPFSERLAAEIKNHHKWFGVAFHYSPTFSRPLRILALTTRTLLMLFFQSLTYDFTSPDDGTCECYTTKLNCLREKSPFGTGQSKCQWSSNSNNDSDGGTCSFIQPSDSFAIVIYVAVFSTIVSTPIEMVLNWLIISVLASPLKTSTSNSNEIFPAESTETGDIGEDRKRTTDKSRLLYVVKDLTNQIKNYRLTLDPKLREEFDGTLIDYY